VATRLIIYRTGGHRGPPLQLPLRDPWVWRLRNLAHDDARLRIISRGYTEITINNTFFYLA